VAVALQGAGDDAIHVRDLGMQTALDDAIFERAAADGRVIVSADSDFATLLAVREARFPSLVLLRHGRSHLPAGQIEVLIQNLPVLEEALTAGAVVSIDEKRMRVRATPLA
jgi:predicted nuclease of predicted toxin-antitoxin system